MVLKKSLAGLLLLSALWFAVEAPVGAWTTPLAISGGGNTGCSVPAIARGSGGKILVAFRRKNPDWRLLYRERSGAGIWGPVETVSVPWSERPAIVEDSLGRPRMFYTQTLTGGKNDLVEAVKSGGVWVVAQLTSTSGYDEDYVRAAADSTGKIHMVYTKTYDGDHGDVIYRVWNGSWSGETVIGQIVNSDRAKAYYHRPDMSVDSANNVHVVWEPDCYNLVYRKFNGVSWSTQTTIGTTTHFFSYAKIAAATPSYIVAVTFDQLSSPVIDCTYSTNGGANWSAFGYLTDGHYPNMDAYNGSAYMIYEWAGGKATGFGTWNSSGWSPLTQCSSGASWQGWADIACATDGVLHGVYDSTEQIWYVTSAADTIAPLSPSPFTAVAGDGSVQVNWTNPSDPDFQSTMVRYKTTGYPTSGSDGTLLCSVAGAPDSAGTFTHSGATNGVTYYYSAFARDAVGNYSAAAHASAIPRSLSCGDVKHYTDGVWVGLNGKVVIANFITSDGCIYVEEQDRTSGIRVATTQAGIALGDRVNVSGTLATSYQNGYAAERYVSASAVTRASGLQLAPLAMKCYSVGGGADGPLVPGVKDAVGLNNIGTLVRISGRVAYQVANVFYVDDGTNIKDPLNRMGVMVRCPDSSIPVALNNIVSVTGVVEGSIGGTWTTNRRCIHLRSYASDLKVVWP